MTTNHTPGPWRVVESPQGNYIIESDECGEIAKCKATANGEALSAFIVRACNAHDELVAVLEFAAAALQLHANEFPSDYENAAALKSVRAALAKVRA